MEKKWPENFQPEVVRDGFGGKLTGYTISLEAWRRGLEVTFFDPILRRYAIKAPGGREVRFLRSRPHMTKREGVRSANNKYRTSQILRHAGIPAPKSFLVSTATERHYELCALAERLEYPVVLKPLDGSMGQGVYAGIRSPEELIARYGDLMNSVAPKSAVLEKHMPGDDHRVLVYDQVVVGVCRRLPANIVGDGRQTVRQLIEDKNNHRRQNPFLSKGLIKIDNEVKYFLARHEQSLDSVPRPDHYIQLRSAANASAGGDVEDVTEVFPETIKQAAIDAVKAVPGLFCAGVDILYDSEGSGDAYHVLELNAHPQIGVNMYPTHGEGQDAPSRILDVCFPETALGEEHADERITLPLLSDVLAPLRTGTARSVTLQALPEHRFPYRKVYKFSQTKELTESQKNKIYNLARTLKVSGSLKYEQHHVQLIVAGDHRGVERVVDSVEAVLATLGGARRSVADWHGVVHNGFHVEVQLASK